MLVIAISLNLILEYQLLRKKRQNLNSELTKIFLVYPPEVIQDNVYLVNFFELRRMNFD